MAPRAGAGDRIAGLVGLFWTRLGEDGTASGVGLLAIVVATAPIAWAASSPGQ